MLHTNNPILKHKAGLLSLAEELQNVSKACKIMGDSDYTKLVIPSSTGTANGEQVRSSEFDEFGKPD